MKLSTISIVGLVAVSSWVAAPAAAYAVPFAQTRTATANRPSDKTLDDRVEAKIKADASLKKYDIDVSVDNAVATLKGTVATEAQKLRAARDAQVAGIARVDNQITVDKDAGKGIGTRTKEATSNAGQKTKEGVAKTGEVINDAWITTKIKTSFVGEDALKGSDINVDTDNHVVTLRGTVKTTAGRDRAVQIAKQTDGVTRVVDHLTIGSK